MKIRMLDFMLFLWGGAKETLEILQNQGMGKSECWDTELSPCHTVSHELS
jgi:hypothetical protein